MAHISPRSKRVILASNKCPSWLTDLFQPLWDPGSMILVKPFTRDKSDHGLQQRFSFYEKVAPQARSFLNQRLTAIRIAIFIEFYSFRLPIRGYKLGCTREIVGKRPRVLRWSELVLLVIPTYPSEMDTFLEDLSGRRFMEFSDSTPSFAQTTHKNYTRPRTTQT